LLFVHEQAGYRKTAFTPKLCREFRSHLKAAGSAASAQRKAEKKQQKVRLCILSNIDFYSKKYVTLFG
jgi:hypothetical protein